VARHAGLQVRPESSSLRCVFRFRGTCPYSSCDFAPRTRANRMRPSVMVFGSEEPCLNGEWVNDNLLEGRLGNPTDGKQKKKEDRDLVNERLMRTKALSDRSTVSGPVVRTTGRVRYWAPRSPLSA